MQMICFGLHRQMDHMGSSVAAGAALYLPGNHGSRGERRRVQWWLVIRWQFCRKSEMPLLMLQRG
jgi:hypothetical protein